MIRFDRFTKAATAATRVPISRPPLSAMVAAPTVASDRSDALDALAIVGAANPASPFPLLFLPMERKR